MRQHVNPFSKNFDEIEIIPSFFEMFDDSKLPLHLDIGCAAGEFLFNLAFENKGNFLQLGVFSLQKNALNFKKKINSTYISSNLKVFIKEVVDDKTLFKVLLGPFENKKNAKNVADNLLELGYTSILIKD